MTDQAPDERSTVRSQGGIIVKRFADGIGFEMVVPLSNSDSEATQVKQRFMKLINDVDDLTDALILILEEKQGYKEKKKPQV